MLEGTETASFRICIVSPKALVRRHVCTYQDAASNDRWSGAGDSVRQEAAMNSLTERHGDKIVGTLSCYDRVVIQGTLPGVGYAAGMTTDGVPQGARHSRLRLHCP